MAGLVPAIHEFLVRQKQRTWMPGSSPGMTEYGTEVPEDAPRHIVRRATSPPPIRHGRARPGHPRVFGAAETKNVDARIPGTSPGKSGHDEVCKGRGRRDRSQAGLRGNYRQKQDATDPPHRSGLRWQAGDRALCRRLRRDRGPCGGARSGASGRGADLPRQDRPPSPHTRRIDRPGPRWPWTSRSPVRSSGRAGLVSASRPSGRGVAPRVLQTPPRDDALALRQSFAAIGLDGGRAPPSRRSCPAHKKRVARRAPPS